MLMSSSFRSRYHRSTSRVVTQLRGVEALEDRLTPATTPLGIEQLVNTTVSGDQRLASIGGNPAAQQVVVAWASANEDGSSDGVYAQRMDKFGSKIGSPFRVNVVTANSQTAPVVAMDSLGSFVVAWQSTNQDGSGDGIYARRYNADGTAIATEFRVNTATSGNQQAPAIAMSPDGDFAVAFQSANRDGNLNAVVARVYRANGTAVGNDFQVNQYTTNNQQAPSIGMDATGQFVVVWQSTGQDGSGDAVVARRYNRDGVAQGNEFIVNQFTTGNQTAPSVAVHSAGTFVVAWQSALQDGNGDAIVARRYDAAGTALAAEFVVNQFTRGNQANPAVASTGNGAFAIAWQSAAQDGNGDAVVARTFSSAGVASGNEFVANNFTTGAQNNPSLALDAGGDIVIGWQSPGQETGGGTSLGVFARRFSAVNDAPVLKQIPNQAKDVGQTVTFTASALDEDAPVDVITYSLGPGAPLNASINPNTGVFTWNTAGESAGRRFVTVRAQDAAGLIDEKVVPVTLFAPGERTALDDYVNAIDPAYTWEIRSRVKATGYTRYNVLMTSGTWRTLAEVNKPLWQHWMLIYVPDVILTDKALLFIDGGSNVASPPTTTDLDIYVGPLAATAGTVVVDLFTVPNQPLQFAGESFTRSEDSIIAYSWRKYLETGDPTWPVNLPMTRAAMRAMDATMDFLGSPAGGNVDLDSFVVSGASKRGWTTWLASATDPRVGFAIPIVADLLNMESSFVHHYAYYNGAFSAAVNDYVNEGILNVNNFGRDDINALLGIVDPYTYRQRLTLPKFIINASGDEFFVPDSWKFYYDSLPGPKWIRYVANTGHGISDPNILLEAVSLFFTVFNDAVIPTYDFEQLPDGTIELDVEGTVLSAVLWQATNTTSRDFRWPVVGAAFTSTGLTDLGGGLFRGNVATPTTGWRAYFIQATLQTSLGQLLNVSSGVYFKGPPTNAQPTLIPIPDMSIPEGSLSLPIIATAPELGQSLTFSLDPGAPAGVSIHPTTGVITGFWADQVGTLAPIIVNVYDNGTPPLPNRDKFILTVVNAAPTAAIIGPPDGLPGETLSFSLQATDPSPVDQAAGFTFQIDWDGDLIVDQTVVGPSGTVVTRSFASVGTHTIRVTATDKDNGTSSVFTLNQTIASWGLRPNGSLIDLLWYGTSGVDRMGFRDLGSGDVRIYSFADEEDVFYGTTLAIASGVTGTVRAFGGDGEDMIAMVQVAHAFIDGGDDDDMLGIFFSPTGSSTILGGQGNDQIFSFEGLGHDVFADGGSENDRILIMSGTGIRATLLGGTGDDFIAVATDTDVTIHAEGGLGDDYIGGGAGDDWIDGGDGDDILAGEVLSIYPGGNDTVMGGAGNDIIIGGAGADLLTGGVGQDFLIAGSLSNYLGDTPFDSIPIADIWRTADPIATRKGHLEGSIPSSLDPMFYLVAGVTVFDDTDVDQLLGGDDEDWFFYDAAEDTHDLLVGVDLETLF